jgi:hypothetical protein
MSADDKVFDPETLAILKAAFEEACMDLPPSQHIPSVRANLAQRILSRASQGERDPERLRAYALMNVVSDYAAGDSELDRPIGWWRVLEEQGCSENKMLQLLEKYTRDAAFDPETVRILTAAFDEVWHTVASSGKGFASERHVKAVREILALRIIEMAQLGERNQRRLTGDALLYLTRSNLKSSGL